MNNCWWVNWIVPAVIDGEIWNTFQELCAYASKELADDLNAFEEEKSAYFKNKDIYKEIREWQRLSK